MQPHTVKLAKGPIGAVEVGPNKVTATVGGRSSASKRPPSTTLVSRSEMLDPRRGVDQDGANYPHPVVTMGHRISSRSPSRP